MIFILEYMSWAKNREYNGDSGYLNDQQDWNMVLTGLRQVGKVRFQRKGKFNTPNVQFSNNLITKDNLESWLMFKYFQARR